MVAVNRLIVTLVMLPALLLGGAGAAHARSLTTKPDYVLKIQVTITDTRMRRWATCPGRVRARSRQTTNPWRCAIN